LVPLYSQSLSSLDGQDSEDDTTTTTTTAAADEDDEDAVNHRRLSDDVQVHCYIICMYPLWLRERSVK